MAENAVMEKAGEIFSKKYAGIPFPVILIGVGVTAYGIRRLIKGQQDAKEVTSQEMDPNGYVVDASGNKFASAYTGAGGGVTPFGTGSLNSASNTPNLTVPTPATEINNEGWLRRASEKLTTAGMWDPIFIQTALMKYVSGANLNQRESAVATQAIKMEGQPPVNVAPGTVQPGGDTTIYRLINPSGSPAVFAQYNDGSIHWVQNTSELNRLINSNPSLRKDNGQAKIDILNTSDPIFGRVTFGNGEKEKFDAAVASYGPGFVPQWY